MNLLLELKENYPYVRFAPMSETKSVCCAQTLSNLVQQTFGAVGASLTQLGRTSNPVQSGRQHTIANHSPIQYASELSTVKQQTIVYGELNPGS